MTVMGPGELSQEPITPRCDHCRYVNHIESWCDVLAKPLQRIMVWRAGKREETNFVKHGECKK